jgi:hypothetical protein
MLLAAAKNKQKSVTDIQAIYAQHTIGRNPATFEPGPRQLAKNKPNRVKDGQAAAENKQKDVRDGTPVTTRSP